MYTEQADVMPAVGQKAPDFELETYPAGKVKLSSFKGKKNVILAFYPKDNTPGCTKEMCAFSEDLSRFENAGTQVLGISCDSVNSHQTFSTKFNLKQLLLADPDGKVGKAYGVVADGKSTASRVLFIIDKNGIIKHVHQGMPENAQLLEVVTSLK